MKMDASKFQVIVHTIPDAHVLHLSGELDLSTAEIFRSVAQPLAAGSALPLKLNLRELTYIDSTGIGLIVALLKTRQSADARLAVQEVPAKIRRLFDTTGLTRFLLVESEPSGGSAGSSASSSTEDSSSQRDLS